jgi:O-antigen/teichoic acid export membrane protein
VFSRLLGDQWGGISTIFPYLALSAVVDAVFSFHSQVLHVLDKSLNVAVFHAVRLALFTVGCVAFLPQYGLLGYGYAEVLSFVSYGLVHVFVARRGLRLSYGVPLIFQALFGVALFWKDLGWPVALAPVGIAGWPGTWTLGARYMRSFRGKA